MWTRLALALSHQFTSIHECMDTNCHLQVDKFAGALARRARRSSAELEDANSHVLRARHRHGGAAGVNSPVKHTGFAYSNSVVLDHVRCYLPLRLCPCNILELGRACTCVAIHDRTLAIWHRQAGMRWQLAGNVCRGCVRAQLGLAP